MTTIGTDLGNTKESARRLRFEPIGLITQTNVQEAIEQVSAQSQNVPSPVPTPVAGPVYNVTASDRIIEVNYAGNVTINLPTTASRGGLDLQIKDVSGALAANNRTITVVPNAADVGGIDAQPNLPIVTDFGAYLIRPGTLVWRVGP